MLDSKKKLEIGLFEISQEFERFRQATQDQQHSDQSQIASLTSHLADLKARYDTTATHLQAKMEELSDMVHEAERQRQDCERAQAESQQLREVVQDLEDKNRRLVEKLNQQILQRVTEYKEKALQALNRPSENSPSRTVGVRRVTHQDENRPPVDNNLSRIDHNRASPLKKVPTFEDSSIKPSSEIPYPCSNPFSRRIDVSSEYTGVASA
jgi:seryl-tRNA synthetase